MNKQQLAAKIWESANRMRSKIEPNEYKDYILGFIFYKYLSDKEEQWLLSQEYTKEDIINYVNEEDFETVRTVQKNLGYFISYKDLFSTWIHLGSDFSVDNVRTALSSFTRLISPSHKKVFEGIFNTLETGLSKLGENTKSQTKSVRDLAHLIDEIPMQKKQDYDVLGFIYEYLISNFAANAGKKAGEFYTPHEVSLLMSEIVANQLRGRENIKIYAPTSGSGSLLINIGQTTAKYMEDKNRIRYYAQELKSNTYNLTRMNLVMRGILPDNIVTRNGDTLEDDWPYFEDSDPVGTYDPLNVDAVVSNPPYSQRWDSSGRENDLRYSRYGLAPKSKADYAFLLHDLYHLRPDGIMAIVLPHGVLFRGGEEGQELREAGVDFEVVPGISSSYSVPAYCGIPVTHRDFASSFHVITGHEGNHKNGVSVLNYETLAKEEGTLIFLMGLKNLPNIVASLIENGKDPATPVGVLQEGTTARQRVATGTLADIVEVVKREGIKTPAITVVGDVVSLRQVLDWYGHKPLSGKSVLVTGTTSMVDRLSPILKEEGAEAISFSLIRTERMKLPELDVALKEIDKYNWIVFTSANGVECFFEEMQEIRKDIRDLAHVRFAVIGDGTKKALEEHGIFCDFIPTAYSSKDMAEAMVPHIGKDESVLLLRAEEANRVLPDALEEAGISHTCISLYHTVTDERKADELNRLIKMADYVTFASSSAVRAFVSMVDNLDEVKGKYISIGPVTTKTAQENGLSIAKTAVVYTARGMVETMIQDAVEEGQK